MTTIIENFISVERSVTDFNIDTKPGLWKNKEFQKKFEHDYFIKSNMLKWRVNKYKNYKKINYEKELEHACRIIKETRNHNRTLSSKCETLKIITTVLGLTTIVLEIALYRRTYASLRKL